MSYAGFYINLDRSPDRRAQIEAQLSQYGLGNRYRRFAAAEGNSLGFPPGNIGSGEMGCFTSHYLVLRENRDSKVPLHIVEDDAVFSRHTAGAIDSLVAGGRLAHYDIIYSDVHIPVSNVAYKKYKDLYDQSIRRDAAGRIEELRLSVVDLKNIGFAATSSMVIAPRAIGKLLDMYETELRRGPQTAIDLFIRRKTDEGELKVGSIFPFVTSVRLEHTLGTTLGDENLRLVALARTLARQSFFVDCDMEACRAAALRRLRLDPNDVHLQILMQVLGFSLTSSFQFAP